MNVLANIDQIPTPFYYYDVELLKKTLDTAIAEANRYNFQLHYAVKANSNSKILSIIKHRGLGADCVSGNEIKTALASGFNPSNIVFAGVGKTDEEIRFSIQNKVACFNCESLQEIEVINEIAQEEGEIVNIAIRINPNIDAKTHSYITTGLSENKFGISKQELEQLIQQKDELRNIHISGLHFHIGSQISDMSIFERLSIIASEYYKWFSDQGIHLNHLNLGGGLGINYEHPEIDNIPPFEKYFRTIFANLKVPPYVQIHFEPGRSIVGQCGNLYTKVLYTKESQTKKFIVVDAGLTELIRPALYQSYHKIENTNSSTGEMNTDVVGPICESSDCFAKDIPFPYTKRGDLLRIYSTGAYGESMASNYNLRSRVRAYYSDHHTEQEITKLELAS